MQYFIEALDREGILAIEPEDAPPLDRYTAFASLAHPPPDPLGWLQSFSNFTHLRIDCPFLRLPTPQVKTNAKHFWAVLNALKPSIHLSKYVQIGIQKLRSLSLGGSTSDYNFLHVRVENDWLGHCQRWGHIPVSDPCALFLQLSRQSGNSRTIEAAYANAVRDVLVKLMRKPGKTIEG